MIRNIPVLDALISKTKQRLLAAVLLEPNRAWYLLELARRLHVTPSSIQRELGLLVDAGLFKRWTDGNRVYFQADRGCPIFSELVDILQKTVGLVDVLRDALNPLKNKIELAFVYGSIAVSQERSSSDVDVMVVGSAQLSEIASVVRKVEPTFGRSVNPAVYTNQEFLRKVKQGSHFLETVLGGELLFVYGSKDNLAKLARLPAGKAAQDQSPRALRSSGRH